MYSSDDIVREFGSALSRKKGAYFIGAGISAASGLPDGLALVKSAAAPLDLNVTEHDDLPKILQYCVGSLERADVAASDETAHCQQLISPRSDSK